jgi:hypothetical protein
MNSAIGGKEKSAKNTVRTVATSLVPVGTLHKNIRKIVAG